MNTTALMKNFQSPLAGENASPELIEEMKQAMGFYFKRLSTPELVDLFIEVAGNNITNNRNGKTTVRTTHRV
jgi:hypothetical protein